MKETGLAVFDPSWTDRVS